MKKIIMKINEVISTKRLVKLIAILLVIYLITLTKGVWIELYHIIWTIVKPFLFGFIIAYAFNPLIAYLQSKGINKSISICLLWIILISIIVALCFMIVPMVYDKIASFITSIIYGVEWIADYASQNSSIDAIAIINSFSNYMISFLSKYETWLPTIVSGIPSQMSSIINFFTNAIFTIIIAIYLQFDFERIKRLIKQIAVLLVVDAKDYLQAMDNNVIVYIKSMLLLIVIRFIEYSIFYLLIGHQDWLIIGLLSAIAAVIPYIGGICANVIGIFTGLNLPFINQVIMWIGIVVLSNVDNYIISPIVHKKRSSVGPLLTLIAIFAGGVIGGAMGIMISLPIVIALRSCIEVYEEKHGKLFADL